MDTWTKRIALIFVGALLIHILTRLLAAFWPHRLHPDPAALELIRGLGEDDQRYFQRLVAAKGKIEAIKEFRARTLVGLKVSKDAIDLLHAVAPALLKFD